MERVWAQYLQLTPTDFLLPDGIQSEEVSKEYEAWLRLVIHSWFSTEPDKLLAYLLADQAIPYFDAPFVTQSSANPPSSIRPDPVERQHDHTGEEET